MQTYSCPTWCLDPSKPLLTLYFCGFRSNLLNGPLTLFAIARLGPEGNAFTLNKLSYVPFQFNTLCPVVHAVLEQGCRCQQQPKPNHPGLILHATAASLLCYFSLWFVLPSRGICWVELYVMR